MIFRDVLYGEFRLPEWLAPFTRLPEFVRLRGVRLSNIDSLQYKDFGAAVRYDHGLAVAYLASRAASIGKLSPRDTLVLTLAGLLHDVGTPPFGHTLEIVYGDIDHEVEAWNALGLECSGPSSGFNAVLGQQPQFRDRVAALIKKTGIEIEPDAVGETINGSGTLGFLIKGSIDLDNTDNVLRGAHYMGLDADGDLALSLVDWLASRDSAPTLDGDLPGFVRRWMDIRDEYYRLFFDCSSEEMGRQALLQFMVREARRNGLPRERLLKTTDDGLITTLADYGRVLGSQGQLLLDAVRKFQSLEPIVEVLKVDLEQIDLVAGLRTADAADWMETSWRQKGFVPMALVTRRRFPDSLKPPGSLFSYPLAKLGLFALYEPKPVQDKKRSAGALDRGAFAQEVERAIKEMPWKAVSPDTKEDVRHSLASWGDWSFIGSRNESIHAYPSTFVHAIPNAFIKSLRLSGDLILDPFCGSGVTGFVAANAGCRSVCSDINEIAVLMSRVRNTYLCHETRERLRGLVVHELSIAEPADIPILKNLDKWHHCDTIGELAKIKGYVAGIQCAHERQFLELCFSAILTGTTARRGKQHGWFADNTPLGAGVDAPPYVNAFDLFLTRRDRNLRILESGYAAFQRRGESAEASLARVSVHRASVTAQCPERDGIEPRSAGAVITSPPYLAMSDYSLGQRLSYAWLYPGLMERDFKDEVGARRRRFKAEQALAEYEESMGKFVDYCTACLRSGGFVATVLGEPDPARFGGKSTIKMVDELFESRRYERIWDAWRPINWHRNHGYERLKREKLTVYVRQD